MTELKKSALLCTTDTPGQQAQAPTISTLEAHWVYKIKARITSLMLYKALGTSSFMFIFFILYLYLLHHPDHSVTIMPVTPIDRLVKFEPWSLWIYLSLWLYVSLPPAFISQKKLLINYGIAIGIVCLIGLGIFFVFPTATPHYHIDWSNYSGFAALKHIDNSGNACPSLHVATAVFSCIWMSTLLKEINTPRFFIWFNRIWCIAILYSTMATKQHVFLDVLAGFFLGAILSLSSVYILVTRAQRRNNA